MKNLIRAIDFSVDHNQLIEDTNRIMEKYPFNKENQICFQNTKDSPPDPYQGTGDSRLDHCPMYGLEERDFTEFNRKTTRNSISGGDADIIFRAIFFREGCTVSTRIPHFFIS